MPHTITEDTPLLVHHHRVTPHVPVYFVPLLVAPAVVLVLYLYSVSEHVNVALIRVLLLRVMWLGVAVMVVLRVMHHAPDCLC